MGKTRGWGSLTPVFHGENYMTDLEKIRAKLGHCGMKWKPSAWLDTGIPDLNTVLGDREEGIPYGRML